MVSLIEDNINFRTFQVILVDIKAENIVKLKLSSVRAFNFLSLMTPKKKRFGIIEEVCQRIGNRSLVSGNLKGSTCIRK